jgi:HEAT repeat protein
MVETDSTGRIKELISTLRSKDGAQREKARLMLVALGESSIPDLIDHAKDHNERVRWEVAKTLEELKNPTAAPAMVSLLMDDIPGIRWLAGEGLINLKQDALVPILKGLQVHFHSTFFLEGAHHVLRTLAREGILDDDGLSTLDALEGTSPALSVPFAAAKALNSHRSK